MNRFWAKVDRNGPLQPHMDTPCWVWTAARIAAGYGVIRIAGKNIYAHRFSWELENGPIPEGIKVDHRCFFEPCVNPAHLRLATNKQNMENRSGLDRNNTSGVRGVWWHQWPDGRYGAWVASVTHNGHRYCVGRFSVLEEAEAAVVAKRNELYTHNDRDRV